MAPILILTKAIELVAAGSSLYSVVGPLWERVQEMKDGGRTEPTDEDLAALERQIRETSERIQDA